MKDRKKDIIPLALHFVKLSEEQLGTHPKALSQEAEEYLLSYDWPGNEEELEIAVKRACILSEGPQLDAEDFDIRRYRAKSIGRFIETKLKGFMKNIKRFERFDLYNMVLPEVERSLIQMVLKETHGNQVKTARLLGINRNTLRSKISKLKIKIK